MDTRSLPDKTAFAAANGWRYEPSAPAPGHRGAIFEYLQNASVTDRFTNDAGVDIGSITGTIGGSQAWAGTGRAVTTSFTTTETATFGYMGVRLERQLPQFVLDATLNDSRFSSSLPMPIAAGQRLSLEGDFDRHFELYCPRGYERDALYIFTPDLMALLIDETGDFDVEIVDDMFFVYARGPFDLGDPALWERLKRIRSVVGAKAITRTDLYADDRDPATIAEGSRLRMGFFGSKSKIGQSLVLALILVGVMTVFGVVVSVVVFSLVP